MTPPALPEYDRHSQDALNEGRVVLQQCRQCAAYIVPAGPCCWNCLSDDLEWRTVSGRGTVWAYVVYHHAFHPRFADRIPYNVATVRLDEGTHLITNIVGVENERLTNGMRVTADIERQPDGSMLLCFRPDDATVS